MFKVGALPLVRGIRGSYTVLKSQQSDISFSPPVICVLFQLVNA